MNNHSSLDELHKLYWRLIVEPSTAALDDDERAALVRDALSANAIDIATARAERKGRRKKSGFLSEAKTTKRVDDELEKVLLSPEFRQAIREGSVAPLAMLAGPRYSIEELDEELNR